MACSWTMRGRSWSIAIPHLAGPQPSPIRLQLDLLGNAERVVDLDAEVTDRAFEPIARGQ
jgi:hypothetical protein